MKGRLAIFFLCAGLLLCCAVGISMLFGCAGVALLVLGFLMQRDFPEGHHIGGNAGAPSERVVPLSRRRVPPSPAVSERSPRHVRIVTIARPSTLLFDQDVDHA